MIFDKNGSVDKKYLKKLLKETNKLRKNFAFKEINKDECSVVYLPIKSETFGCFCEGLSNQYKRQIKNIKYSDKIRANCKNYLKIYKNKENKVVFIECYPKEESVNLVYLAHYEGNVRYLFPFCENGEFYPTCSYVAKFENDKVVEEYQVDGNQIVYELYFDETKDKVNYYLINYVPTGTFPVLDECWGIYYFNPLRFELLKRKTWLDERNKK